MIQGIKKSDQYNDVIFGGRFFANKPVFNVKSNIQPYSCLYYWSNAYVNADCEFGLHPHQGFEIMAFLFEGSIEHYDTATKIWTPLNAGDFQIIQSNSGISHQERIKKGSRAFQIWFDPNFENVLDLPPSYVDYHGEDFHPKKLNGYDELTYVGEGSLANTLTTKITIRKLLFENHRNLSLTLNEQMSYTFYVLNGKGKIGGNEVEKDDAIRIKDIGEITLDFIGEIFYIETPSKLPYETVWMI